MAGAVFKTIGILKKEKPTEIIGFGNYITIPVLVAAIVIKNTLLPAGTELYNGSGK